MIEWECHFCHEVFLFEKPQQKGAHITNCNLNPKRQEIRNKIAETNTLPRIELILICSKCDKKFSQFKTQHEIDIKDYNKFCRQKCANSHNVSEEQKKKTSASLFGKIYPERWIREIRNCAICSSMFECWPSSSKQTCGDECYRKLLSNSLIGKTGGYRTNSGTSKFYGQYYKNVWMDSSWEVALAIRLDELNIIWERDNTKYFLYIDLDGKERKYYPDFYLPDFNIYLECKGYWTEKIRHKIKNVQEKNNFTLIILDDINLIKSFNILTYNIHATFA